MLRLILGFVALGLAVFAYASLIERYWWAVRRHHIPCLASGARPLRVLHVSDLHMRAAQRRKQRFLAGLAALEPDVVVATGDLLEDASGLPAAVAALGAIPARAGRVFVLGSHDHHGPAPRSWLRYLWTHDPQTAGRSNPWRDLVRGLEEHGWQFIDNRTVRVGDIEVLGLGDAHIGRADLGALRTRAAKGFRMAIAHSPDIVEEVARHGYDLILCGHTHGGQVRVPLLGALVTNSTLPLRMARGAHRIGNAWLHVSAGLGTSKFAPIRFSCRPEVCVLELVPRNES
ncbi:MAG: metallophosphoesterase [Actinomycetota bacterium]